MKSNIKYIITDKDIRWLPKHFNSRRKCPVCWCSNEENILIYNTDYTCDVCKNLCTYININKKSKSKKIHYTYLLSRNR